MGTVNDNLKAMRERKRISQQEVADYLGITRQAYSHYEVGRRKPDYETLLKLAEFYGVSVLDLLEVQKAPTSGERSISDDDIKFALFGGDGEITDEMFDEVRNFAAYVKQREAQKKKE